MSNGPHQTVEVEAAIDAAVTFGVDAALTVAKGLIPNTPELRAIAISSAVTGIRKVLALLNISPRVDVTAGPEAVVNIHVHDNET